MKANKSGGMKTFPYLRRKILKTLILGFVVLTFYAYYRTTINETLHDRSLTLEEPITSSNNTPEVVFPMTSQSSRNSSLETPVQSTNFQRILNNGTSQVTSVPSSIVIAFQSPLVKMNSQGSNNNDTIQRSGNKISSEASPTSSRNATTVVKSATSSYGDNTTRAMYVFGHDVRAAEKCPENGREMDLLIIITSAPDHFQARTAIRQTWGNYDHRRDVAVLFVLGLTKNAELEESLKNEQSLYGDVIRGRFVDSYSNLTLKTISSLEWANNHCNEVKYMLKTDDDMFINVPRLLSFVGKHKNDENSIFGRLVKKWKPVRNKKSKYYVTTSQFMPNVFPDFTTGPAYLLSRDVFEKLYVAALEETYLKLEDVLITGIVAQKLGIKRYNVNEFFNKRIGNNPCTIQRAISIHMVTYSEQFDLWKKLLDGKSKCK